MKLFIDLNLIDGNIWHIVKAKGYVVSGLLNIVELEEAMIEPDGNGEGFVILFLYKDLKKAETVIVENEEKAKYIPVVNQKEMFIVEKNFKIRRNITDFSVIDVISDESKELIKGFPVLSAMISYYAENNRLNISTAELKTVRESRIKRFFYTRSYQEEGKGKIEDIPTFQIGAFIKQIILGYQ